MITKSWWQRRSYDFMKVVSQKLKKKLKANIDLHQKRLKKTNVGLNTKFFKLKVLNLLHNVELMQKIGMDCMVGWQGCWIEIIPLELIFTVKVTILTKTSGKIWWIHGLLNFIALLRRMILVQYVFTTLIIPVFITERFQIVCMWMQNWRRIIKVWSKWKIKSDWR